MPSRFLPNTDVQRTAAMDAAFNKAAATPVGQWPFGQAVHDKLVAQRTIWRQKTGIAATSLSAQSTATGAAEILGQTLGQLVSHFIQVFNLGVARNYFSASARAFYQLDISSANVPPILTQADRLTWSQNLVDGEAARANAEGAGYKPMAVPTSAEIAAARAAYLPALETASTAKDTYDTAQQAVQALRPAVDDAILDVWDNIEYTFRHDDPASLRRKAREWGVVYINRPGETPDPAPATPTPAPPTP